jgi:hypothetical protein
MLAYLMLCTVVADTPKKVNKKKKKAPTISTKKAVGVAPKKKLSGKGAKSGTDTILG